MSLANLQVARLGTHGPRTGIPFVTINQDLGAQAQATTTDNAFAVPGVAVNDWVECFPVGLEAGLQVVGCWVSAANTVQVRLMNVTGAPIDPAAHDYTFVVLR